MRGKRKTMNRFMKAILLLMLVLIIFIFLKFFKDRNTQAEFKKPFFAILPQRSRKCKFLRKMSDKCLQLFEPKNKNLKIKKSFEKNESKNCRLEELVKDCSRLRFEHGYEDKPVSKEEMDFPIAFAIKMHKDSHQVERLLRTIYRPHNFYCIHVDSKATIQTFQLIKNVADCLKNVVVLTNRINVVYASIRFLEAEFACMKRCLESDVKWKYYINLAGQELILKTNLEIVKILEIFNGANDVESFAMDRPRRILNKFIIKNNKLEQKGSNKKFKYKIEFRKGSAFGLFSKDFVDFVLNDEIPKLFFQWLNTTLIAEETFYATINNWPFTPGGYPGGFIDHKKNNFVSKFVIWQFEKTHFKCRSRFVREVCILSEKELPVLYKRTEIAANKFYESLNPVVLDCLEEWLNTKTYSSSLRELNVDFYKNLPQVKFYKNLKDFEKKREFLEKRKKIWMQKVSRIRKRKKN